MQPDKMSAASKTRLITANDTRFICYSEISIPLDSPDGNIRYSLFPVCLGKGASWKDKSFQEVIVLLLYVVALDGADIEA